MHETEMSPGPSRQSQRMPTGTRIQATRVLANVEGRKIRPENVLYFPERKRLPPSTQKPTQIVINNGDIL